MAKGKSGKKSIQVKKSDLREAAGELGVVGAVEAVAGINDVQAGAAELGMARDLNRASKVAAAVGASDLTRGADRMRAGQAVSNVGEVVAAAGVRDVEQGAALLSTAGEAAIIAHMIKGLSKDDISQGMELAGMAGQMRAVRDVVDLLGMRQMSDFLSGMTTRLHAVAVYDLVRSQETRVLAATARGVAGQVADAGRVEEAEGIARIVVGTGAVSVEQAMREEGALEAVVGMVELQESAALGEAAGEFAAAGLTNVAEGARSIGAAEATVEAAQALEQAADA